MALETIISGITGSSFREQLNNNFSQLYPILVGNNNPTTSTIGVVGQEFVNQIDGTFFICQNISANVYTWKQIERNDLYPIIVKNLPPTTETVAIGEGQQYLNTSNNEYYICTSISNGVYNWVMMNNDFILAIIVKDVPPDISTVSDGVGQLYLDKNTNKLYICKEIDAINKIYTWILLTKETVVNQIIINELQPVSQRINDYWFKIINN